MDVEKMTLEEARATKNVEIWMKWNRVQGPAEGGKCPGHIGAGTGRNCCICGGVRA